jgi:hypothetical protein
VVPAGDAIGDCDLHTNAIVVAEVEGVDAARRTVWVANALRIGIGKSFSLLAYHRASRMLGWPEDIIEAEGDSLIANTGSEPGS